MKIDYIPCDPSNYRSGRSGNAIRYIVMHYTANNGDTAENNGRYFQNDNLSASAHYFVDEKSIVQSVRDDDTAWHCGGALESSHHPLHGICMNRNSIGVELCSDKENGKFIFTEATVDRAVELVKYLMQRYGVPVDRVVRHYDVTGKDCPEPWVRNPKQWEKFLTMLTEKEDEEVVKSKKVLLNGKAYDCECIDKNDVNYIKMRSLTQAGFNVVYDAVRQQPSITAPQSRTFVPDCTAEVQEAVDVLRENVGLEQQTIEYLRRYQWGDELVKKLAKAVKSV